MQRYAVLFILMSLGSFELCGATGKVSFKLDSYNNALGKVADDRCCDEGLLWIFRALTCRDACDHFFIVCVDTLNGSATDFNQCRIGRYQTGVTEDKDRITFGSSIGKTANPSVFKSTNLPADGWFKVKVKVQDSDVKDRYKRSMTPQLVDTFHADVKLEAGRTAQFYLQSRTQLKFSATIVCNGHWYGSTCDVYCKRSEDYYCLRDGSKHPLKPPQRSVVGSGHNDSNGGSQAPQQRTGPQQSKCGVKPHFSQSFAAKTVVPAKPKVDVVLSAIPKKEIPVITVKCNDTGHYTLEAYLKDIFTSILIYLNTSVSRKLEAPLDRTCLPHVLAVYARPRPNKKEMNINTRTQSAFCGPDKQAEGSFGPDDQLLAVVPFEIVSRFTFLFTLTGLRHKISLDTELEFGKYSCQLCGNLTLILHVDPLRVLNDKNPCNNFITLDVTFDCEKCRKPNNEALKELPLLHPNQPPLLKYCGAGRNGENIIVQAKNKKGSFQWTTLHNQEVNFRDMMKFPLAYQIMEMLKKTDVTCPRCFIRAPDFCSAAGRQPIPGNVDMSDWKNFVTKMQSHVTKVLSKKYNRSSKLTPTKMAERWKRLSTNINSSVECVFKKLKQVGPTTCPFRRDMLPKLYQFQYDACRNFENKMLGQVGQLFDDYNSEDMADGKYLGAFADSLCPENRPDSQEERRDFCAKGAKKLEMSEESSCNFVSLLRNILRESKSARQLLFPKLNKDALARMGPNLLSQRLTNTLIASGISRNDLEKSTLWNVIKGLDKKCQPDPSYPGCAEPTHLTFFKEDGTKTLCMVKNPDKYGEMCAVECATSLCGCNSTAVGSKETGSPRLPRNVDDGFHSAGDKSSDKDKPGPIGPQRNTMRDSGLQRKKRHVEDEQDMTDFEGPRDIFT